jgi:hypothetical protein
MHKWGLLLRRRVGGRGTVSKMNLLTFHAGIAKQHLKKMFLSCLTWTTSYDASDVFLSH